MSNLTIAFILLTLPVSLSVASMFHASKLGDREDIYVSIGASILISVPTLWAFYFLIK